MASGARHPQPNGGMIRECGVRTREQTRQTWICVVFTSGDMLLHKSQGKVTSRTVMCGKFLRAARLMSISHEMYAAAHVRHHKQPSKKSNPDFTCPAPA